MKSTITASPSKRLPSSGQSHGSDSRQKSSLKSDRSETQRAEKKKKSSSGSPIGSIDPSIRAINTIMFGVLVHFGTLWTYGVVGKHSGGVVDHSIESTSCIEPQVEEEKMSPSSPSPLLLILLLHEYWVYLQHSNVLANPYCQRLDRQYGIALLKSNQHWAIAGTLSAYWCRESICMFLCLAFLPATAMATKYLIAYSLIYHTIKSRGVRQDALRRYSPTLGIMRVVIDKFYLHSKREAVLSLGRLFLQGLDTYIHHIILRDLLVITNLASPTAMTGKLHILFVVWVLHAAMNQYFRRSTASIMVQAWYAMTAPAQERSVIAKPSSPTEKKDDGVRVETEAECDNDDELTEAESISSHGSSSADEDSYTSCEQDFIVRKLLRKGRLPQELEGRQGTASDGVDTAIRLETVCAILTVVFLIGFNRVPLRVLGMNHSLNDDLASGSSSSGIILLSTAWLMISLLHGIWSVFLRGDKGTKQQLDNVTFALRRSILNIIDLGILVATGLHIDSPNLCGTAWALATLVISKSYIQETRTPRPKIARLGMKVIEFVGKMLLLRGILSLTPIDDRRVALLESGICLLWASWVVLSTTPRPCEVDSVVPASIAKSVADSVFLGHPAELIDCWALWLLPYSLEERWNGPFWAIPLWPIHYAVGCGTHMQTWIASHFGRHFVTNPGQVKRNIEAAARYAEDAGVKVLCLGALNKAESINGGGVGVCKALGDNRQISIIHGNHLTAAAVVETTVQCLGDKARVFLTGASSKVGWAVAQALRDRHGYQVLCHSTDAGRRKFFEEQGFAAASKLSEGTLYSPFWIVGKYDFAVARFLPFNGKAVVFSVPHSLGSRSDVKVIEAGTLHMDLSRLDRPRQFTNKLKEYEIFACHAASVVAHHPLERDGLKRLDEVGPVDPNNMDSWLQDAKSLGFQVPKVNLLRDVSAELVSPTYTPQAVVVGAGPAGLAVAASMILQGVAVVILEQQKDPTQFGSWEHHFSGLEVTSQTKWCNLPGFAIPKEEFPGETITASNYRRYLQLYAARFGLVIKRGITVKGIEKDSSDPTKPWVVSYYEDNAATSGAGKKLSASAVVVATGKHRVPMRDTENGLADRLAKAEIPMIHSADMKHPSCWNLAIQAAKNGRLVIIGFGNSAADLATAILKECPKSNNEAKEGPQIHIAARTIPPVFPRRASMLRVDTIGYFLSRLAPSQTMEDVGVKLLWHCIPSSRRCNAAFPAHLQRWSKIGGRVPVIDKYGAIASGFTSGRLQGHGPVTHVDTKTKSLFFDDYPNAQSAESFPADLVIMATGYKTTDPLVTRSEPLNGLYTCGFGKERFLPLHSIGEQAQKIARDVARDCKA